jgi:alpha-beta hydrolase superfamily lysophospholipase
VNLRGWFIPGKSNKTVLIVHGVGSNRGATLGIVPFLHRAGFRVFTFDLRGHGDSGGHTTSFGAHEGRDVDAALVYLQSRRDVKKIGVLAFSMGGSALLHAVGENGAPGAQAVILDSTFAEFESLARAQMAFLPDYAARPLLAMISFYARLEIGVWLRDIAPQRFINRIAPRPLLLIHGTDDTLISPEHANTNFAAAGNPTQLWMVPGANHVQAWAVATDEYEKRVVNFLNAALTR